MAKKFTTRKCTCCPVRVATGALCKACNAELEALKQKS